MALKYLLNISDFISTYTNDLLKDDRILYSLSRLKGKHKMKSLVVYYSFEGDCKLIGETIANEIGADILELVPKQKIEDKEFVKKYLGEKQVLMKTKPILEPYAIKVDDYDLIIIGSPVWSNTFAPAIRTFLDSEEIKNKNIALFYCFTVKPGRISKHFQQELKGNKIISELGCKDPLKENTERTVNVAKDWAKELIVKLQKEF